MTSTDADLSEQHGVAVVTRQRSTMTKHATISAAKSAKKRTRRAQAPNLPAVPKDRAAESTTLYVHVRTGESNARALARHVLEPEAHAACTIGTLNKPVFGGTDDLDLTTIMAELQRQSEAVNAGTLARGEAMLAAQAQTLDSLFHVLTRKGVAQGQLHHYDTFIRLALKAQSQCRTTWEGIAEIKNPRSVAFVRQANIAQGHQQVNNHAGAGETESPQTKLLETTRNEWMDAGATRKTGRSDQALEAVGEVNRAA
jgi:hypothetical protein